MPIYKEKGRKKYRIRVNYVEQDGTYKAKYGSANSYEEAARKYQELYEGRYTLRKITLSGLCESYLSYMKDKMVAFNTLQSIKFAIKVILKTIDGDIYIEDISPAFIRNWQTKLLKTDYSIIYIRGLNMRLSAIMNYGRTYYGLKGNPVKLAGRLSLPNTPEKQFYTLDEFKRFLCGFDRSKELSYWVFFNILFYTGCRLGEVLALYPSDIDFRHKNINITKTFSRIHGEDYISLPKTETSIRKITIPPFLVDILKDYISRLPNPGVRIFFNLSSGKIRRMVVRICKKTGVKYIRIHDFRHSAISFLASKGVPILEISRRAGHSSANVTYQIYAHQYPERDREIADREENDFKKWDI